MADRTVSIAVDTDSGTKRKHFNAENISFVQAQYSELTRLAHALIWGVPILTLLVLVRETNAILALLGSAILWVALSAMLFVPNEMRIATVTDIYDLEEEVEGIESQFLNAANEVITVEGSNRSRYNEYLYRYHVVPQNVVSVDHKPTDPFPLPTILAVFGVAAIFLGAWADLLVQGGVLGAVGLALAVYTDPIPRPDELTIEYGVGREATFEMTSSDATEFVAAFQDPRPGQVTIGSGIEDGAFDATPSFDDEQTREALSEFRQRTVSNLISENAASLRSDDPGEREFGVASMYPFRVDIPEYREAVGPLLSLLTDTSHVRFRSLIGTLLQRVAGQAPYHFDGSADQLADLLSHPDPAVRGHATDIAEELLANPETPDEVRRRVDRGFADAPPVADDVDTELDEEIRSDLTAVLDDLLATYVAKLYSSDPSDRQLGLVIATSYRTDIEVFEQLVAPLLSVVWETTDHRFRDEATDVLVRAAQNNPHHFAGDVGGVCELLTHTDHAVRTDAATILAALADHYPDRIAQHRDHLEAGLDDDDIQTDIESLMHEVDLRA